jgi:hypothetical protein
VTGTPAPLRLCAEERFAGASCAVVLVRTEEAQFHLGLRRSDEAHEPVIHLACHRRLHDEALAQLVTRPDGRALPAAVITLTVDQAIDDALPWPRSPA